MITVKTNNYIDLFNALNHYFKYSAERVATDTWQGVPADISMETMELRNVAIEVNHPEPRMSDLVEEIGPHLPWADDHFEERVCGKPINPGKTWEYWRHGESARKFLNDNGKFNHNYMERFWPKYAGDYHRVRPLEGIRNTYGDLYDLVDFLASRPADRAGILPVWFPEDTGIGDGGRKPCTMYYHFMVRNRSLEVHYDIRSCDYINHCRDDIYLALKLQYWLLEQLAKKDPQWLTTKIGTFSMWCKSLHCFINDYNGRFK